MMISEAAERSGLSIDTIRFYEKSGICPSIARGADGKRHFTKENVDWLTLLSSLRDTGMPIRDMKEFATLYQKGDETVPERKRQLLAHSQRLALRQTQLDRCKELLAYKLQRYDEIIRGSK